MLDIAQRMVKEIDEWIAELEQWKQQRIDDLSSMHAGSSLFTPEAARDDPEMKFVLDRLDELFELRKDVIEGEATLKKSLN
jgi:hypothetical protein